MSIPADRAVALLRSQRHSFLNHLQVVNGWLQLGDAERALRHIERLSARMGAEGRVLAGVGAPEAALFVLAAGLQAEAHGVTLEWRTDGPVDVSELAEAGVRVAAALGAAARLPEAERRLVVSLGRPIGVHTGQTQGEG